MSPMARPPGPGTVLPAADRGAPRDLRRTASWPFAAGAVRRCRRRRRGHGGPYRGGPARPAGRNREATEQFQAIKRHLDRVVAPDAVVFLPRRGDLGFMSQTPFLQNGPALDEPVLYAEDRNGENFEVVDRFPTPLLPALVARPRRRGRPAAADVGPLRVEQGSRLEVRLAVDPPDGAASAYITEHSPNRATWRSTALAPGPAEMTWTVLAPAAPARPESPDAWTNQVSAGRPAGVLTVGIAAPGDGRSSMQRWERRIPFRVVDGGRRVQLLRPAGRRAPPTAGRARALDGGGRRRRRRRAAVGERNGSGSDFGIAARVAPGWVPGSRRPSSRRLRRLPRPSPTSQPR